MQSVWGGGGEGCDERCDAWMDCDISGLGIMEDRNSDL